MSMSSFFVVTNALRLRRFKPTMAKIENGHKNEIQDVSVTKVTVVQKNNSKGDDEKVEKTLKIKGMMCNHCKIHVEKALNSIEGVSVEVNLEDNSAKVSLSKEVSNEVLKKAVEEAGYEVTSIIE